jgi:hypothetical protein
MLVLRRDSDKPAAATFATISAASKISNAKDK